MAKSASSLFPFKESPEGFLERATTVEQTLNSAIKCFIFTPKNSRLGNPVGSRVPELVHKLLTALQLQQEQQELQLELSTQFPEVTFVQVTLTRGTGVEKPTLSLAITYSTPLTQLVELSFIIN